MQTCHGLLGLNWKEQVTINLTKLSAKHSVLQYLCFSFCEETILYLRMKLKEVQLHYTGKLGELPAPQIFQCDFLKVPLSASRPFQRQISLLCLRTQERTRPWYFNRFSDKTAFAGLSRISSRDILELAQSLFIRAKLSILKWLATLSQRAGHQATPTMSKRFIRYGYSSASKHEEDKVSPLSISVKWQIMLLAWLSSPQTPVPVTDVWCRRAQNWQVLTIFDRNLTQMLLAQLNIEQKEKQNLFQYYRLWC